MAHIDPWLQNHRNRIGDRIHRLRMRRNLTQEQLAAAANLDRRTISKIENGHTTIDSDRVHLIAQRLGVEPSWIFSDDDIPADEPAIRH